MVKATEPDNSVLRHVCGVLCIYVF